MFEENMVTSFFKQLWILVSVMFLFCINYLLHIYIFCTFLYLGRDTDVYVNGHSEPFQLELKSSSKLLEQSSTGSCSIISTMSVFLYNVFRGFLGFFFLMKHLYKSNIFNKGEKSVLFLVWKSEVLHLWSCDYI